MFSISDFIRLQNEAYFVKRKDETLIYMYQSKGYDTHVNVKAFGPNVFIKN